MNHNQVMNLKSAYEKIKRALERSETIVLAGRCRVIYQGRAKSNLKPGDRVVMVKQDGSLIIHRPTGHSPVNWQPPKCHCAVSLENQGLKVRAVRSTPSESVETVFDQVYFIESRRLLDGGEFTLHLSEEEMKAALVKRPSLLEEGLRVIEYEKKVEPGFIDLYCRDKQDKVVVVEIKRNPADKAAALQLKRYLSSLGIEEERVRGIIAAPALTRAGQRTLELLGLEFRKLTPRECLEAVEGKGSTEPQLLEWLKEEINKC